jgi:hypothetical protein
MPTDFSHFQQRLNDLFSRLDAKIRTGFERPKPADHHRRHSAYWTLRELFTKDVTADDLKNFLKHDTRDTFQYFTKEIDFDSLRPLPWYKRYAISAWRVFLALAYRLSPPRRIAFAVAIFAFLLGLIKHSQYQTGSKDGSITVVGFGGAGWWLICIVMLFLLLFMELRDKLGLKGDLEIAREIQMGLVPSKPFHRDGFSIFCHMRPANTVGGDYYDILELGENQIGVVIGDVAGKGMPAALMMALLQGSLRTLVTAGHRGPELISKLNDYLWANIPSHSLITLFYGELNSSTGDLCFLNCGHNAPFLVRSDQGLERLVSTSMVLGIQPDPPFQVNNTQLQPGDALLLFTDGITEAFNESEEEYGEDRVTTFLQAHRGLPSEQILQLLVEEVLLFCGHVRPGDDMTLMLIKRQ